MPRTSATTVGDHRGDEQDDEEGVHAPLSRRSQAAKPMGSGQRAVIGERAPVLAGRAQRRQRRRAVALGEALAVGAGEQRMMVIVRGRQTEQRLEQAVDVRSRRTGPRPRTTWVTPLRRIVDRHGEMIAGGRILAREHDVAVRQRVARHPAGRLVATSRAAR